MIVPNVYFFPLAYINFRFTVIVLVMLLLAALVISFLPWPGARKAGRVILFFTSLLPSLILLISVVIPFFAQGDAGIGFGIFIVVVLAAGFFTYLFWSLYRVALDYEKQLGERKIEVKIYPAYPVRKKKPLRLPSKEE